MAERVSVIKESSFDELIGKLKKEMFEGNPNVKVGESKDADKPKEETKTITISIEDFDKAVTDTHAGTVSIETAMAIAVFASELRETLFGKRDVSAEEAKEITSKMKKDIKELRGILGLMTNLAGFDEQEEE